jgi:hypothetical protein
LSSLLKDYETYKKNRNVTFIGINTSITANLKTMESQVKQFKLQPFANMLDAGGATPRPITSQERSPSGSSILDGGGKIAYNASRGWSWSDGPDAGKFIHQTQLEKSLKAVSGRHPRLQGGAQGDGDGRATTTTCSSSTSSRSSCASTKARAACRRARSSPSTSAGRSPRAARPRKEQIEALSKSEPIQAYREAIAFATAYPAAPERAAVNELGRSLLKTPEVKKEIEAGGHFQQIVVPELKKTSDVRPLHEERPALLDGYLKTFGATQYGAAVKIACEAHKAKCK